MSSAGRCLHLSLEDIHCHVTHNIKKGSNSRYVFVYTNTHVFVYNNNFRVGHWGMRMGNWEGLERRKGWGK